MAGWGLTYAKVPPSLTFDRSATIPVAATMAAAGLYNSSTMPTYGGAGLVPPWIEKGRNKYAGQPILVIGGSLFSEPIR